jgi:UDP-GlcNAc3NAcA epimerase
VKTATIVGARPQFIKIAPMSRALRSAGHTDIIIHTGQHYDANMSAVFFSELDIPSPHYNLDVGSGTHGFQTGEMLKGIEHILMDERPSVVIVYGDTNSTLAGALAAAKLLITTIHVEAGLRSFDRRMPEEINRVVTDHLADILFCPGEAAAENLRNEGVHEGVHIVGDIMADALLYARHKRNGAHAVLERLGVCAGEYLLATVHRAENADDTERLLRLLNAFEELKTPIVFPIHPRTRNVLASHRIILPENVLPIEPVGYLDMTELTEHARYVLTDSGGLQKEAYWLGVPCFTLRESSEWVETIDNGWNTLVGTDTRRIVDTVARYTPPLTRPVLYGDGQAAGRCTALIEREVAECGRHTEDR